MAFIFPEDKADFLAPNGVTYSWDGTKWVTKTFKADESVLEDYATEEWTEEKIADAMLDGTVALESYATIEYSDTKDASLQNQIDELGVTKGKVARYTVENTSGVPVSRTGQLAVNTSFAPNVNMVSFGIEDSDGVLTKPMADGDIIEFVDVASSQVSRYQITDATGAPTAIGVAYISGDNGFVRNEEEQVYIYPQNKSGASKDYVDAQDAILQGQITDNTTEVGKKADKDYVEANYLKLSGGTMSGELVLNGGDDTDNLSIYANKSNDDSAITALNSSTLRLRTSPSGDRGDDNKRTHLTVGSDEITGSALTNIYHLSEPVQGDQPATKTYVDNAVTGAGGGVPVGSVMIWLNSTVPDGWLKLQGGSFDVSTYPQLHAYLQGTNGYTSGKLPNWSGHYPGEYGSHLNDSLGKKVGQRTAQPSGGAPKSTNSIPNGSTRTFNGAGNTNAYSDGASIVAIDAGWDNYTRPQTVIVHYIIKHD